MWSANQSSETPGTELGYACLTVLRAESWFGVVRLWGSVVVRGRRDVVPVSAAAETSSGGEVRS